MRQGQPGVTGHSSGLQEPCPHQGSRTGGPADHSTPLSPLGAEHTTNGVPSATGAKWRGGEPLPFETGSWLLTQHKGAEATGDKGRLTHLTDDHVGKHLHTAHGPRVDATLSTQLSASRRALTSAEDPPRPHSHGVGVPSRPSLLFTDPPPPALSSARPPALCWVLVSCVHVCTSRAWYGDQGPRSMGGGTSTEGVEEGVLCGVLALPREPPRLRPLSGHVSQRAHLTPGREPGLPQREVCPSPQG